jgi:hypothetical protein
VKPALQLLNKMLQADPLPEATYQAWRDELEAQRTKFPMQYPDREDVIAPQHAVEVSRGCEREDILRAHVCRRAGFVLRCALGAAAV